MDDLTFYDVPVPRYTSYPTVPYWDAATHGEENWKTSVRRRFAEEQGEVSVYIHLPFCESLCTFCACNKRITKNHGVEDPYLEAVICEWAMYRQIVGSAPVIREIHLGGGTPTFFAPDNLKRLIDAITDGGTVPDDHEFSVEVHPNSTSYDHLAALRSVGFNRISIGVQDFDPTVQYIINRMQTFDRTRGVVDQARSLGFDSVNVDLVYGLPKQTLDGVRSTMAKVGELMPDRIAYYSYAHVPWKSKGQRRYTDDDVPAGAEKYAMYTLGRNLLAGLGYGAIGMDHFALPSDALMTAWQEGMLHRNFMGYTTTSNKLLIGLGVSSISDSWDAFSQNEKVVEDYQDRVRSGVLPIQTGHALSAEDLVIRGHILDLMCRNHTLIRPETLDTDLLEQIEERLEQCERQGLVRLTGHCVDVLEPGRQFIRNVCASFDAGLIRRNAREKQFSQGI